MTTEERIKFTNSLSLKDLEFILVTRVQDIKVSIGSYMYNENLKSHEYSDGVIPGIYCNGKSIKMVVGYADEYE